jgi:DnaJ domain
MTPNQDLAAARMAALALLGLPEHADKSEIVRAYRCLAKATHPDATGRTDPEAGQGFSEVHDAYQLLGQQQPQQPQGQRPAAGPGGQPQAGRHPAADPLTAPARPRRTPMQAMGFRTRAPIVAGPVIVTGLPEQRSNRRRRR